MYLLYEQRKKKTLWSMINLKHSEILYPKQQF